MHDDSAERAPPVSDARSATSGPVPDSVFDLLREAGERLGPHDPLWPRIQEALSRKHERATIKSSRNRAFAFVFAKIEEQLGAISSTQMAMELNKRAVSSPSGLPWTPAMVRKVRERMKDPD